MGTPEHLVLDLDPPEDAGFDAVVAAAHLVRRALDDVGLAGVVKTTGSKGVHILVPLAPGPTHEDVAGATRALAVHTERLDPSVATTAFIRADRDGKVFVDPTRAGGSTIAAVYSPRVRPGLPVSFPVTWDELDTVVPSEITVRTAPDRPDPWSDGDVPPGAPGAARGSRRRGPHHPRRPRPGHARGQAPQAGRGEGRRVVGSVRGSGQRRTVADTGCP